MPMKTALFLLPVSLCAQWLDFRTPGIPRTADGKPNLSAPAPKTPDGKPDLSGVWRPEPNPYFYDVIQELKDEAKESDGRPETKQRIRQLQQTLARRRMMHKVPAADVVIVNPTHFAVALKYDPKNMRAPRVLAKGLDLVAANIRRIAEEHRVPVFEAPKLARALYKSTDLNREIPAGLYVAVAQVLSYVFKIRTLNPTLAARMARPDPTVGDEYADV